MAVKNRWAPWIAAILLWSDLGALFALPNLSSSDWTDTRLPFLAHLLASVTLTILYLYAFTAMRAFLGPANLAKSHGVCWRIHVFFRPRSAKAFCGVDGVIFGVQQTFRYYEHCLAGC
ncbi:MAG: hypothetical protein AUF67_07810 [Acidobacteria bacterium 13_1_20CM_58_21]|nr:MAG: hypothetical protein AUF67_07810 [Acidobacteria bacterium 13_1_20CM_58_21]